MNCRDFLNEFEERAALSGQARLHLNDCPGCRKASGEQTRVWQMIDGLNQVNAPNDFDFRVKARIANARPTNFQPRFLPVLRFVLPAALIVSLVGLFAFNTTYFSGGNAPPVVVTVPPTPIENPISPVNSFAENQIVASEVKNEVPIAEIANANVEPTTNNREKPLIAVRYPAKTQTRLTKKKVNEDGGSSRVLSSTPPESPRFPLGFDSKQPVEPFPNLGNQNSIADVDILKFIGIETVPADGGRKVKTIKSGSSAERSGVKVGDVVEQLNGIKISEESLPPKIVEAKTLTVMRGAEKVEITLKN